MPSAKKVKIELNLNDAQSLPSLLDLLDRAMRKRQGQVYEALTSLDGLQTPEWMAAARTKETIRAAVAAAKRARMPGFSGKVATLGTHQLTPPS